MGNKLSANTVELTAQDGVATIEQGAVLTRLHYFDGKFLRADALTLEQEYHRRLVRLSNLAGGWGVVHGFGIDLSGTLLGVSPGLAITPAGSTVLLTQAINVEIAKLIAAATSAPPPAPIPGVAGSASFIECTGHAPAGGTETAGTDYYEITAGPVEALCGNEEVYGKLCEDACVTDSQRPYWREGLMLRLRPITLALPGSTAVTLGAAHLRNRVASAYFAYEPWLTKSLLSARGLASGVWCNPAALYTRDEVPIGLLVREGETTRFIDAWSARRERMETQARGYWQGRMMMRPWNVFLAQILQFQCQLAGAFKPGSTVFAPSDDECARLRELLNASVRDLTLVRQKYAEGNRKILEMLGAIQAERKTEAVGAIDAPYKDMEQLAQKLADAQQSLRPFTPNRLLVNGGFVELPSAGYLAVIPGKHPINEQVQRMFGEGVNLHFCTARPDYIAHALEQAQHMERISLTRGLDDPTRKEEVEIFVPDGEVIGAEGALDGTHWFVDLDPEVLSQFPWSVEDGTESNMRMTGVARTTRLDQNGSALTMVCQPTEDSKLSKTPQGLYLDLRVTGDPFAKQRGDEVPLSIEGRVATVSAVSDNTGTATRGEVFSGDGTLTIEALYQVDTGVVGATGTARLRLARREHPPSPDAGSTDLVVPLQLSREGSAVAGRLLIALRRQGTVWAATWGGTPRDAVFGTVAATADKGRYVSVRDFAKMHEADAPLRPESTVRLAALNTLALIAEATEDGAFLERARRRLFPDTATPEGAIRVRAMLDWVMFRRQRKATCDAICRRETVTEMESFQTWHLKLDNAEQLPTLVNAIDNNNAEQLKDLQRVDVLHYADEADTPAENTARIVADWRAVGPSRRLVLGRVWERAPRTGQGWQNHFRLRRLVDILEELIDPPATDVIHALQTVPSALDEPAFDGAMLLVTLEPPAEGKRLHRVFFVPGEHSGELEHLARTDASVLEQIRRLERHDINIGVHFLRSDDSPVESDLIRVKEAYDKLGRLTGRPKAIALVHKDSDDNDKVRMEHESICSRIGAFATRTPYLVSEIDFGGEAYAATIVFFNAALDDNVNPPAPTRKRRPRGPN